MRFGVAVKGIASIATTKGHIDHVNIAEDTTWRGESEALGIRDANIGIESLLVGLPIVTLVTAVQTHVWEGK